MSGVPRVASAAFPRPDGPIVVVGSDADPVAARLAAIWGTPPATGWVVDGTAIRRWDHGPYYLRRAVLHIHDERLDRRLPPDLLKLQPTLVFPSIHRSAQNVRCFTVHPLGNLGPDAEVGGLPRTLVPSDPELMTATLRTVAGEARSLSRPATFEATHHGPDLGVPAFFVEIGFGELTAPPEDEVRCLARVLPGLVREEGRDHVALGIGGGHYAPHFTDLALRRRWSFGHLLSRHALGQTDAATVREALRLTPGALGLLYHRAADQDIEVLQGVGPRLREGEAPERRDPS